MSMLRREVAAQALFFDFGGTLDADGVPWEQRFHAAYSRAGGTLPRADFQPLFKESDRRLERLPGIETLGFAAMAEAQARLLLELVPDGSGISLTRIAQDFVTESLGVVRRNRPLIQELGRTRRLGIISNFTGNLTPCLEELGLNAYFGVALDSAVVGVSKPDHAIFEMALGSLGARPESAWMIGDNFEADVRPAGGLGMRTAWLAPAERDTPSGCTPTARLHSLTELPGVLARCTG